MTTLQLLLTTILLFTGSAQAAGLKPLSKYKSSEFQSFLSQVDQKLPKTLKNVVGTYQVGFFDSNLVPKTLCTEDVPYGDLVKIDPILARQRIYLHKVFQSSLLGTKSSFPCKNRPAKEIAEKALIYQMAKLYDTSNVNWHSKETRERIDRCTAQYKEEKQRWTPNIPTVCSYYLFSQGHISESPNYKSLSDYAGEMIRSKNKLESRIGNITQTKAPGEHFAINVADFLTDPTYQCRRPSFQTFFTKIFKTTPFASSACQPVSHIFTSSASWKIDIAPEKVYQVHYLFATRGQEFSSRWGHAMIRFVVCAPERQTVGPECLGDVAYHLVLSYRANINDVIINYWDGLTGAYPSQLMMFSMPEMVDEYTRGQWRDLQSIPFKFSETQKRLFVQNALEHYWSYAGDYKFLTNNCASESDQLIRAVLPNTHPYQDTNITTPKGMVEKLAKFGIIDSSVLRDRKEAQSKGYFFPSQKESLEKAFAKIRKHFPRYQSMEQWAHESKASERKKVYETFESFQLIGSSYILEKYVQLAHTMEQQKRLTKLLQTKENQSELQEIIKNTIESAAKRLPWELTKGGYGVPVQEETLSDDEVTARWKDAVNWGLEYRKRILEMFPDINAEMKGIQENIDLLINRRNLSEPPGTSES